MRFRKRASTTIRWCLRKQIQLIRRAKEMLREAKKLPEKPPSKDLRRLLFRIFEILSLIRLILLLLRENWKGSGRN